MKKTVIAFIVILLSGVVFTSCEKNFFAEDFFPQRSFCVHMTAQKNEKQFEADIICRTYEDIEIAFTYPKELSGFSVKTTSEGYSINVFGVPDEISEAEIKDNSLLNILIGTIKTAVFTNHGSFTESNGFFNAQLTVDSTPVDVTFSDNGFLYKMSAPAIGFSADFEYSG